LPPRPGFETTDSSQVVNLANQKKKKQGGGKRSGYTKKKKRGGWEPGKWYVRQESEANFKVRPQ